MRRDSRRNRLLWVFAASRCVHGFVHQNSNQCGPSTRTRLYTNVATTDIQSSSSNNEETQSISETKLSRPERKAFERKRKEDRKNTRPGEVKANKARATRLASDDIYPLHSTAISQLDIHSTADSVMRAIKRAQNLHDGHDLMQIERFLFEQTDATFFYGFRGSLLARLAVAALHMNQNTVAVRAMQERTKEHADTIIPYESAALVRGLLRVHNVTAAWDIIHNELALCVPPQSETASAEEQLSGVWTEKEIEILKYRASALASIASRHFFEGEPCRAVAACQHLAQLGPITRDAGLLKNTIGIPWIRLIRGAAICDAGRRNGTVIANDENHDVPTVPAISLPCNLVYSVLNAMTTFPSDNDDRVYEQLSNALVRRVIFVTGAIDMKGCPPSDRGEAAFIGRSNVGKSSLVNMITNRKSLAYTSKRPGKTQQFNFFAVNDKPGIEKEIKYGDDVSGEKDPDSFYLVDLPGFGYARVPEKQRRAWIEFMAEYLSERRTLRVVFHLIDGRIGPTEDDAETMKRVGAGLKHSAAQYVVVLTKADKNVKGSIKKDSGRVSRDLLQGLRQTMNDNGIGKAPIIVTSAETKLGRDDIWRYLKIAAEA
jgi:GTP-binding protein